MLLLQFRFADVKIYTSVFVYADAVHFVDGVFLQSTPLICQWRTFRTVRGAALQRESDALQMFFVETRK